MAELCALFGVSKQAYYQYDENAALSRASRQEFALQYIKAVREEDPGIGGMKLWHMYKMEFGNNEPIGRDSFCRIVSEHGLNVRKTTRKPKTTDSSHGLPTYRNLVEEFVPTAVNQLWVSDITYITIIDGDGYYFCYLSLILDAYSEEIIGWSVGLTLETEFPMQALRMALARITGKASGRIHHSDRGVQYASHEYTKLLQDNDIRISMTESGDPKDNAQAERINNTMKNELLAGKEFHDISEVIAAVAVAVDFYNNRRPHMSVGMLPPAQAAQLQGDRDMKWKSQRIEAIKAKEKLAQSEKRPNFVPGNG